MIVREDYIKKNRFLAVLLLCFAMIAMLSAPLKADEITPLPNDERTEEKRDLVDEQEEAVDKEEMKDKDVDTIQKEEVEVAKQTSPETLQLDKVASFASGITLVGAAYFTLTEPLSGENFTLNIQVNSIAGSDDSDIENLKISFKIPTYLEVVSVPTSGSICSVSPQNPKPGDTVTVTYNNAVTPRYTCSSEFSV